MKKNIVVLIVAVVALVSYLFLPYISFFGTSMNFIEMVDFAGDFGGHIGIMDVLPIISAVVVIIAAIKLNKKLAFSFSIVGLVTMIAQLGQFGEKAAQSDLFEELMEMLGIGFWLTLIAFAVNIFLSKKMEETNYSQNTPVEAEETNYFNQNNMDL